MNITIGRGRLRQSFVVPCAEIVKRASDDSRQTLRSQLLSLLLTKA